MVLPQAIAWVQYWFRVLSLKFCGKSKKNLRRYISAISRFLHVCVKAWRTFIFQQLQQNSITRFMKLNQQSVFLGLNCPIWLNGLICDSFSVLEHIINLMCICTFGDIIFGDRNTFLYRYCLQLVFFFNIAFQNNIRYHYYLVYLVVSTICTIHKRLEHSGVGGYLVINDT